MCIRDRGNIVRKWRLQPGKMFLIDLEQGRIVDDEELKNQFANARPYQQWIDNVRVRLDSIPADQAAPSFNEPLLDRQQAFGYTQEDIKFLMSPMAQTPSATLVTQADGRRWAVAAPPWRRTRSWCVGQGSWTPS